MGDDVNTRPDRCTIEAYDDALHRQAVIELWTGVFGYSAAHNDPALAIDRKLAVHDGLFFVACGEGVVGTVIGGYDGHRGWIYSLAVRRESRGAGIGTALMERVERALAERGCLKINLQIVAENGAVERFYRELGYSVEPRISMGKRLPENSGGEAGE